MKHLLGIDIGTTGSKAVLFDVDGNSVASSFVDWPLSLPNPGWAEQAPEDWWEGTVASIRGVLGSSGVDPGSIVGIGLSGQMHGLVLLDQRRSVLRPSIIWCDQRTAAECAWITEQVGADRLIAAVSNPALPGFTAPKLIWVRDHERDVWSRATTVLLPKDYVRMRLTGEIAIEISDAAGTALYNVVERRWALEVLETLGIPSDWLPPVISSADVAGRITGEVAEATGLRAGTPVVGGGADNACAAIGNGVIDEGLALVSVGSSGVVLAPSRLPRVDPRSRIHTFNHAAGELWYLMGVTQAAGLSLRWFRDEFGLLDPRLQPPGRDAYDVMTSDAATSSPGSRGLVWLPYLQGERTPHLDPDARGVLFGLSTAHTHADVYRSVLEGVAFSLRDCLTVISEQGLGIERVRLTGGGARSELWRQIIADVLGLELEVTASPEGAALGAALLAGVGTSVYRDLDEATAIAVSVGTRVWPDTSARGVYDEAYALFGELYRDLRPAYARAARSDRLLDETR